MGAPGVKRHVADRSCRPAAGGSGAATSCAFLSRDFGRLTVGYGGEPVSSPLEAQHAPSPQDERCGDGGAHVRGLEPVPADQGGWCAALDAWWVVVN